ncbi:MAG: fructose-1,6-bisphosphatase [Chloroflexaceae bacterium]|nr:fructose-1,6-bisphosphatase [Chloroflexaceae bacterium]
MNYSTQERYTFERYLVDGKENQVHPKDGSPYFCLVQDESGEIIRVSTLKLVQLNE